MPAGIGNIGALSLATGVKVPTIRYYEQIGLLGVPERSASNRRRYTQADADRLAFIRHARDLGFEIDAIRELLALAAHPEAPCDRVDDLARRHLADIDGKIARLTGLRGEIARMLADHQHGTVGQCHVIAVLADHGRCTRDHH